MTSSGQIARSQAFSTSYVKPCQSPVCNQATVAPCPAPEFRVLQHSRHLQQVLSLHALQRSRSLQGLLERCLVPPPGRDAKLLQDGEHICKATEATCIEGGSVQWLSGQEILSKLELGKAWSLLVTLLAHNFPNPSCHTPMVTPICPVTHPFNTGFLSPAAASAPPVASTSANLAAAALLSPTMRPASFRLLVRSLASPSLYTWQGEGVRQPRGRGC